MAVTPPVTPPAVKPGRNDPCWCGSGKKYKRCHLREDEEAERKAAAEREEAAAAERTAAERQREAEIAAYRAAIPVPKPTITEPSPEDLAADEAWERFEAAGLDEKIATFEQRVDEKQLDEEDLFGMLEAIRADADTRANADARARFRNLVECVRTSLPEVYRAERGYLLETLIEDAIADQDWDRIAVLLPDLGEVADENIDTFRGTAEALMYHGQTRTLFDVMMAAWPAVSISEDVTPFGVEEYLSRLLELNTYRYLETTQSPQPDDPALFEPLAGVSEYDPKSLRIALAHLSSPGPWQGADFDQAADADTWDHNVQALLHEFVGERWRRAGVPLGRGGLMRELFCSILHGAAAGARKPARRKGKHGQEMPLPMQHPRLVPTYSLLDRELVGSFSPFDLSPYPAVALMEMLPAYLSFLVRTGVIQPAEMDEALADLEPMVAVVSQMTDMFWIDALAVANMQNAWSPDALAALRSGATRAYRRIGAEGN